MAWRAELRDAIRDPGELLRTLRLEPHNAPAASEGFPLLVPRGFATRMRPGDPRDPLLRQVLPTADELAADGLPADAVGDLAATRAPGMLHKYAGRVLLTLSGSCAVNCRYCFRRHFPYGDLPRGESAWEPALREIESDASIAEVILSGGDPLVAGDERLARLVERLSRVAHLRRLRIHTRLPVVIPSRVTGALCDTLSGSRLSTVVVLHVNHANEVDSSVGDAAARLRAAGATLLNQSVLLRGVNDSADALQELSERLLDVGIIPYYLHALDLVSGVGHFDVPIVQGERFIIELRGRLPGYAVPRLVREVPGEPAKTVLA